MLFNSSDFLIFFPIATLGYYLIPNKIRYLWLLVCSYYFYMCWNPIYSLLLLFSTCITWGSGLVLEKLKSISIDDDRRTKFMRISVAISFLLNLSVLGYFKYTNFIINNINVVLSHIHATYELPTVDILLPVGISFYTFQALSYTMDVYRNEIYAEKNFFRYALFVSFFPQLVAGPIERSKNLLKQLNETHIFSFEKVRSGYMLMLWGYFLKMVLADRISIVVNTVYGDIDNYPGWYLIIASILFAFQIYCDFAGYSTIAMGAAQVMGFRLMENFNAPYFSQSVSEFWRRWHISLSSWFRDYLYIPLGGNRKGKIRRYINLMIVFLFSGLWHGSSWNFIAWGGINGIYQILGASLKPIRNKMVEWFHIERNSFSHKLFRTVFTFLLIDFSWIFFRASQIKETLRIIRSILLSKNVWILFDDSLFSLGLDWKNYIIMIISIMILIVADYFKMKGIVLRDVICRQAFWFRWSIQIISIMSILVLGMWGSGYNAATFIYFQF